MVRELAEGLEHRVADLLTITATVVRGLSDEAGAGDVLAMVEAAKARAELLGTGGGAASLTDSVARADELARRLASALADLYVSSCAEAGSAALTPPATPALRSLP